jgi:hypothetical protein
MVLQQVEAECLTAEPLAQVLALVLALVRGPPVALVPAEAPQESLTLQVGVLQHAETTPQ